MRIVSTQYTLLTKSFEIYLSGCDGECGDECHTKELWEFNQGEYFTNRMIKVRDKVKTFNTLIDWIWVLGGEPLLQDHEDLIELLNNIRSMGKLVVLFTRFELDQIPEEIKSLVNYIKTGKYDPSQKC